MDKSKNKNIILVSLSVYLGLFIICNQYSQNKYAFAQDLVRENLKLGNNQNEVRFGVDLTTMPKTRGMISELIKTCTNNRINQILENDFYTKNPNSSDSQPKDSNRMNDVLTLVQSDFKSITDTIKGKPLSISLCQSLGVLKVKVQELEIPNDEKSSENNKHKNILISNIDQEIEGCKTLTSASDKKFKFDDRVNIVRRSILKLDEISGLSQFNVQIISFHNGNNCESLKLYFNKSGELVAVNLKSAGKMNFIFDNGQYGKGVREVTKNVLFKIPSHLPEVKPQNCENNQVSDCVNLKYDKCLAEEVIKTSCKSSDKLTASILKALDPKNKELIFFPKGLPKQTGRTDGVQNKTSGQQ